MTSKKVINFLLLPKETLNTDIIIKTDLRIFIKLRVFASNQVFWAQELFEQTDGHGQIN